jgi:uncharacterized protein (DUF433 family)
MDTLLHDRIAVNPNVCHGQPVIAGTRIPVSQILSAIGSGESVESLLANYPTLKKADIDAAIAFAGVLAKFEEIPETAAH